MSIFQVFIACLLAIITATLLNYALMFTVTFVKTRRLYRKGVEELLKTQATGPHMSCWECHAKLGCDIQFGDHPCHNPDGCLHLPPTPPLPPTKPA